MSASLGLAPPGPAPACPLCRRDATPDYADESVIRGGVPTGNPGFLGWACRPCREYVHPDGLLTIPATASVSGDLYTAAGNYMLCGWYVLPLYRGKHAGSIVGRGWPEKSTRDMGVLRKFLRPSMLARCGLALHVGRSGAVAFDVDTPANAPRLLRDAIEQDQPPFQSTRRDDPDRGHYLWALPVGVMLGNGLGQLATDPVWGEVRGRNGIIVVQPTAHIKAEGRYEWRRAGRLPTLPPILERALVNRRPPVRHEPRVCSPVYTHQWIRGILTRLLNAEDKQQNKLLFWAACRFGEMVAAGVISEQTAYDTLIDAGMQLPNYDPTRAWRISDITGTVVSGLAAGQKGGRR